jgi:hypothetical protein
MGGVLTDLVRWVIDVVHSLGYVGVFVLMFAGSVYLPVPTELTLPLFGFLIGNGRLSFAHGDRGQGVCCALHVRRRIQAQRSALAACDEALRKGECGIQASRGKSDPGRTLDPRCRRPGLCARRPEAHACALAVPWLHDPRMQHLEREFDLPGVGSRRPVEDSRSLHVFRRVCEPYYSHRRNGLVLLAQAEGAQVDGARHDVLSTQLQVVWHDAVDSFSASPQLTSCNSLVTPR